jgi:aspartyl-tRNA(Asn)/glutamyl-tRNA(Gln) amidotransferase subunit C
MKITEETIYHVADLAKLSVCKEEKAALVKDFNRILSYMETMNELNTQGVEPMSHVLPMNNVFRADVAKSSSACTTILENAPRKTKNAFVVPQTVE